MRFAPCSIDRAWTIDPAPHEDERGRFMRAWCSEELSAHGIAFRPVQANMGLSHLSGTIRGLHYQVDPAPEAKLVRCTRGSMFDVVVDLRPGSPTFREWYGTILSADNGRMLFLPEGCAHGCQSLDDQTEYYYLTSAIYTPAAVRGARYDDPSIGIEWPLPPSRVSTQDLSWPLLEASPAQGDRR
jgi:dTDP-4-dehydrorhamnose 3,5-epimerase